MAKAYRFNFLVVSAAALTVAAGLAPAQTPGQLEYERQQRENWRQQEQQRQEQQRQQQLMQDNARRQQEESSRINAPSGGGVGGTGGGGVGPAEAHAVQVLIQATPPLGRLPGPRGRSARRSPFMTSISVVSAGE